MKVLVITNLFGFPWDQSRGVFNQQQFDRLSQRLDLTVLVAIPWTEAIRRPRMYWSAKRDGRKLWPYVDYFIFWYPPGMVQFLHSAFFLLSLVMQRPMLLFRPWHALIGSWGYPDAVATVCLGGFKSTPVLMKLHGTDVNGYLLDRGKRWQILAAARRSQAVMTASSALRDQLINAGIDSKLVRVNYNGVNANLFCRADKQAARTRLQLELSERVLLFVGNLKFSKGCVELLASFLEIAQAYPTLHLYFIGDGEARSVMSKLIAGAPCAARVHMLGKLDHSDLPDWFSVADLFCLPSHDEGLPNVVLEAMACGVPVVATRVGGIPEVVPDFAGLLIEPGDSSALSSALRLGLSRSWNHEHIAAHGRGFDWAGNVDTVVALLNEIRPNHSRSMARP